MRLLIDGYNVMHAAGLMAAKLGPERFRQARLRFLNDLADLVELEEVGKTTIVFDAATPPEHLPATSRHKGLAVEFAVGCDDADQRIEALIAAHSSPRKLTVVSSDQRIRHAATRRKARSQTADAFLDELDRRRGRKRVRIGSTASERLAPAADRPIPKTDPAEAAFWVQEFGGLEGDPDTAEAFREQAKMMSDEDLRQIELELDVELDPKPGRRGRPKSG